MFSRFRQILPLLFVVCLACFFGCASSESAYQYNNIEGITDGCPLPADAASAYQTAELDHNTFAEMTGIDLSQCLPKSNSKYDTVFQYGFFSEDTPSQPSLIHSSSNDKNGMKIDITVIWDTASQSVMKLFQPQNRIVSSMENCDILFYHEPANSSVNYDGVAIYAAAFSIEDVKYYVRIQNDASANMLEEICSAIIHNCSKQ